MTQNTREKGRAYAIKTLILLSRLGYATTRQVARAVWSRCDDSTRKMASRTIRRLLADGLVVERRDGDSINGERLIALTAAGAGWLSQEHPLPGGKPHARDWLRHAHSHRTMCNSVYCAMAGDLLDMDVGWTELEIRNGVAPPNLSVVPYRDGNGFIERKVPDILLTLDTLPTWVEVENTWRSAKDLQKLIEFMRAAFAAPTPPIASVWLVITAPGASTIGDRLRKAMTHAPDSGYARTVRELDERILCQHVNVYALDHVTLGLHPCDL